MSRTDPSWDLYRSFLAVLREGSLSGAARALNLTQPTIARHVAMLEDAVGCTLFLRSQRGLAATQAALELQPYAEALAATAAALVRAASGQGDAVRGTVRVTASEVVGAEVLPPILTTLHELHPGLVVELVLSNEVEDILQRDADIAVRMVEPVQQALVVRRIGDIPLGLHAHPAYLARRGTPRTLEELEHHSLIGFDRETPAIRNVLRRMPWLERTRFALRTDSDLAQLAAIRAGFGIGVCQVPLARREPRLVRLLPDRFALNLGTWLVMHEDLRSTPRCRAVFDGLASGLKSHLSP
ncbi:LysR family transcriptional regulator [Indioceanicola profundi]|uniref:LysR family transcriptional regulator n=1 Tax=Indioceanicola profundi TaxID=2220096 RepID=UPI000E6AE0FC|nr:LysR family transcriptional regulator [Indioceanicola profundi]